MFEGDTPPEDKHHPSFNRFFIPGDFTNDLEDLPLPQLKVVKGDDSVRTRRRTVHSSSIPGCNQDGLAVSPAAMFLSSFSAPGPSATAPLEPDEEGALVAGYILGPIIGYGGFSTIRKASSTSGGTVAVKIVRRKDISRQPHPNLARKHLDHEAAVWSTLSHEHILPLFHSVHTLYADFFVTLFCPAGSLFDILKRDGRPALPQDDAGMMFRQVVRGLRYLHEVALLVHRDIKLENILVDETGVCRIGDFGMTRRIGESDTGEQELEHEHEKAVKGSALPVHLSMIRHQSARHRNSSPFPETSTSSQSSSASTHHVFRPGSLPYASPELLLAASVPPHPAQDMWALGVLLYTLLTGRLPFTDSFEPRLQMKILHGVFILIKLVY